MTLFPLMLTVAALLAPGQLVMIDLALDPAAAGKRPVAFDAAGFRAALAQQLTQSGVPVGAGDGMSRLVIRVTHYDPGNGIAIDQKARMAVRFHLLPAKGAASAEYTASCESRAKFNLMNTPGGRARRAYANCLNELAMKMSDQLVGGDGRVIVR